MSTLERLARLPVARHALAAVDRLRAWPPVAISEATVRRFLADGMVDRGASLAYYGLLSLLPMLMIVSAVVGLLGADSTSAEFESYLRDEGASASLADTAEAVVKTAVDSPPNQAGTVGLVGLLTLIYGASRAFAAAGRALDVIWRRRRKGLTVVRRVLGIGWTLVLIVLGLAAAALAFIGRALAEDLLGLIGLDGVVGPLWSLVRWPLAALLMMLSMRVVMWAAPSPPRGHFTLLTPGAMLAAGGWLAASGAYGFYVGEVSSYNTTYGAFAALVILLLWIWLTAMVFLVGCEFDAVLAERRVAQGEDPGGSTPPGAGAVVATPYEGLTASERVATDEGVSPATPARSTGQAPAP